MFYRAFPVSPTQRKGRKWIACGTVNLHTNNFPPTSCQHKKLPANLKPCDFQFTSNLKPAEAPHVSCLAHCKSNGSLANRLLQHLVISETLMLWETEECQWIMFNYSTVIFKLVWRLAFGGNDVLTHHKGYMPSLLTMKTMANVRNRRSLSFWHLQ